MNVSRRRRPASFWVEAATGRSVRTRVVASVHSFNTLRNWEQGRRTPEGPALALLRVAAKNPKAVAEALHGGHRRTAA